jgi:hypothetical protein
MPSLTTAVRFLMFITSTVYKQISYGTPIITKKKSTHAQQYCVSLSVKHGNALQLTASESLCRAR